MQQLPGEPTKVRDRCMAIAVFVFHDFVQKKQDDTGIFKRNAEKTLRGTTRRMVCAPQAANSIPKPNGAMCERKHLLRGDVARAMKND